MKRLGSEQYEDFHELLIMYSILETGVRLTYILNVDTGPAYSAAGPAQVRRTKTQRAGSKVYSSV
jgi:hypothetical protein